MIRNVNGPATAGQTKKNFVVSSEYNSKEFNGETQDEKFYVLRITFYFSITRTESKSPSLRAGCNFKISQMRL